MAFIKEQRIPNISSVLYITPKFGDILDTWESLSVRYPDEPHTIYNTGWSTEEVYDTNIFLNIRDSVDDDNIIVGGDGSNTLNWESLSEYTWSRFVPLTSNDWSTIVNWEDAWQVWRPDFDGVAGDDWAGNVNPSLNLATLDGNWEDVNQLDMGDTIIDNQFLSYTWAGIDNTWSSLT